MSGSRDDKKIGGAHIRSWVEEGEQRPSSSPLLHSFRQGLGCLAWHSATYLAVYLPPPPPPLSPSLHYPPPLLLPLSPPPPPPLRHNIRSDWQIAFWRIWGGNVPTTSFVGKRVRAKRSERVKVLRHQSQKSLLGLLRPRSHRSPPSMDGCVAAGKPAPPSPPSPPPRTSRRPTWHYLWL